MNKFLNKKVLILGLSLLILAGIVVVLFRGFNVNFMLEQHEVIEFVIGKDFEIKDVSKICKEVFGNKKVVLKTVEVFDDAVSINVESITNEEKTNLINKLNEKYGTEKKLEEVEVKTVANVRIRDWVKPYIKPILISGIIILGYIAIKFREENTLVLIVKILGMIVLTVAVILSILAIFRVPILPIYIIGLITIGLVEVMIYTNKLEKKKAK